MEEREGGAGGDEPRYFTVGAIRKPHGIKGELFVWLETDHPEAVFQPGRVLLLGDAQGRPVGGTLTVERSRPFKDGVLLRVHEHATRTEATDALRGRALLIPEAEAPPLAEDEVFYHQLIGMRVLGPEGEVGTIREVQEGPGADLLVVRRENGGELLIPFVRAMIRRLDPALGEIEIDPPAGLLEL
jgi:16S rRNA processing protein RimM